MEKDLQQEQASQSEEVTKLEGDDAILLWLKGKDVWNNWAEENPGAEVNFEKMDFHPDSLKERLSSNCELVLKKLGDAADNCCIDFRGYRFPGRVSFRGTRFLAHAEFAHSVFSEEADFGEATFYGDTSFIEAEFRSIVRFEFANFESFTSFTDAKFRGLTKFFGAAFRSSTNFLKVEFSEFVGMQLLTFNERVNFDYVIFNKGVSFTCARFTRHVSFSYSEFCDSTDFSGNEFCFSATFDRVVFHKALIFSAKTLSAGRCSFEEAIFKGVASFTVHEIGGFTSFKNATFESTFDFDLESPRQPESAHILSFEGAEFFKGLTLSGIFPSVPDLRKTKMTHHVGFNNLSVTLRREPIRIKGFKVYGIERANDTDDSERLCRLKELAESSKDYRRALLYNAYENRAKRWGQLSFRQSLLDMLYSFSSNYGQSISRPFMLLLFSIVLFTLFNISHIEKNNEYVEAALTVSIATVTPFVSISKRARERAVAKLYGDSPPMRYDLYSYIHAFMSFIFIFLIGLGLRNRFRI